MLGGSRCRQKHAGGGDRAAKCPAPAEEILHLQRVPLQICCCCLGRRHGWRIEPVGRETDHGSGWVVTCGETELQMAAAAGDLGLAGGQEAQ